MLFSFSLSFSALYYISLLPLVRLCYSVPFTFRAFRLLLPDLLRRFVSPLCIVINPLLSAPPSPSSGPPLLFPTFLVIIINTVLIHFHRRLQYQKGIFTTSWGQKVANMLSTPLPLPLSLPPRLSHTCSSLSSASLFAFVVIVQHQKGAFTTSWGFKGCWQSPHISFLTSFFCPCSFSSPPPSFHFLLLIILRGHAGSSGGLWFQGGARVMMRARFP